LRLEVMRREIHPFKPNHLGEMFHVRENRAWSCLFSCRSFPLSTMESRRKEPFVPPEAIEISMLTAPETRFVA